MSVQIVKHGSREFDIVLNFASTENNLSWAFTQEGDGEIFDVVLTNVASYTLGGSAIALPYSVTNRSSYSVSIVKTTTGQTASITLKTRRANNKITSVNVPDLSNLSINGCYVLLTNVGNNGQVVALSKTNANIGNYAGAGVWTNSIVRGTINLPDIATPYGSPVFSWTVLTHANFNGSDYVLVVGHATSNNSFRGRVVCLINPSTLAVTNLDGTANSYTYITNTGGSDSGEQQQESYICENFIANKILIGYSYALTELDINNRIWNSRPGYPTNIDLGLSTAGKTQFYFNPIDNLIPGSTGMFGKDRMQMYATASSGGSYDYLRNVKLGTVNYWGRIKGYDKNGLTTWSVDNTTISGVGFLTPKNNLIFTSTNTYVGYTKQLAPYTTIRTTLNDKTLTTHSGTTYMNENGDAWLLHGNSARIHLIFVDRATDTITQGYYDLSAIPISVCTDKILISA